MISTASSMRSRFDQSMNAHSSRLSQHNSLLPIKNRSKSHIPHNRRVPHNLSGRRGLYQAFKVHCGGQSSLKSSLKSPPYNHRPALKVSPQSSTVSQPAARITKHHYCQSYHQCHHHHHHHHYHHHYHLHNHHHRWRWQQTNLIATTLLLTKTMTTTTTRIGVRAVPL